MSRAEGLGARTTYPLSPQNPEGITVISQDLLASRGIFASSFHLPELIRCPTGSSRAGGGRGGVLSLHLS